MRGLVVSGACQKGRTSSAAARFCCGSASAVLPVAVDRNSPRLETLAVQGSQLLVHTKPPRLSTRCVENHRSAWTKNSHTLKRLRHNVQARLSTSSPQRFPPAVWKTCTCGRGGLIGQKMTRAENACRAWLMATCPHPTPIDFHAWCGKQQGARRRIAGPLAGITRRSAYQR